MNIDNQFIMTTSQKSGFKNNRKTTKMKPKSLASYRTSDRLEWDTAMNLVNRLYRKGEYKWSLLIGCGCFFGLRISDLLSLTWDMLLSSDRFVLQEKKTGKRREIKINEGFQQHIALCHDAMNPHDDRGYCFQNRYGGVMSTQWVNRELKRIREQYDIPIQHFSSHTFRKTFGYRVFTRAGENAELALYKLSEIFNHSNTRVTRRYLGIRRDELLTTYDMLDF